VNVFGVGPRMCRYRAFGDACNGDLLLNFDVGEPSVQLALLVVVAHLALYVPNAFVIGRLFLCELAGVDVLALGDGPFAALTVGLWAGLVAMMACVPREDVAGVFAFTIDLTGAHPPWAPGRGQQTLFFPRVLSSFFYRT